MKEQHQRDFKGVWIPKEIWLNPALSITERCLLVELDSLDNDPEKGCFASNEHFGEFLSLSAGTAANMICDLKKRGFIVQVYFDGRKRGLRLHEKVKDISPNLHENVKADFTKTGNRPSRKREHSNTVYSNTIEDNTPPSLICQVVDYLNAATGRKFEYDTRATVLNITARNKKGRTLDDFKAVIDFKAAEWMNDPEYFKHLNPETLFGNKMEKYLNAALAAPQAQPKANTDTALKDCDLPPDIAERYAAYMNHAQENYPALWASNTRVFSHCDYLDYWNDTSVPSLQFSLTAQEKRGVMLKVHEEINGNKFLRERYTTVHQAYLVAIRQAMKRETIKI